MKTYTLKRYEEICSKVKDLIRSTNRNSYDYDEKYMKIKLNLDDDLPFRKTIEFYDIIRVVRSVFGDGNKYYVQVFLDKHLYKLTG